MTEFLELDLNEMPYPPPENVISAARKGLRSLNRYTDPGALQRLKVLLSEYAGVTVEKIVIGPGSDLLLREVVLCFAAGRKVVIVSPTFLPTAQVARRFAGQLVGIRLSPPEFSLAQEPLLEELKEPSLVIIDNPNNPTGRLLLDRERVESILDMPEPDDLVAGRQTPMSFAFGPVPSRRLGRSLGIKIAVITNGALIERRDVRSALRSVDWVSFKLDSVTEINWRRINRPHTNLKLDRILEGMLEFKKDYSGTLVTETMLIRGLNDGDGSSL